MRDDLANDETIIVTIEYKGKRYTSQRLFTKEVIEIMGYPDINMREAQNGAYFCMRQALVAEGKIENEPPRSI